MARKPRVPEQARRKLDQKLEEATAAYRNGDKALSLKLGLEMWDLIPEPKHSWDYYAQSLSHGFVRDYADLGNVGAAEKWLAETYKAYDDPNRESDYVLQLEGETYYKLEMWDRAYDAFGRKYELHGREAFPGEYTKYLEFYLKERAKRGD